MARRKKNSADGEAKRGRGRGKRRAQAPAAREAAEEQIQGPPARETTHLRSDREREAEERIREHTASSPELTGGDPDADWERADSVGEEAVGGTVSTPDQSVVDDLGEALGVPRSPDDEVRPSSEILEDRDRDRWDDER